MHPSTRGTGCGDGESRSGARAGDQWRWPRRQRSGRARRWEEPPLPRVRRALPLAGNPRIRGPRGRPRQADPAAPDPRALPRFYGIADRDSDRTAREKIVDRLLLLDESLGEFLPLLFDLLGVADPERPAPAMDAEARLRRLLALVRPGVQARSRREASVTLYEHLHWWDAASERFLEELVEAVSGTRTLLLVNFRPEPFASPLAHEVARELGHKGSGDLDSRGWLVLHSGRACAWRAQAASRVFRIACWPRSCAAWSRRTGRNASTSSGPRRARRRDARATTTSWSWSMTRRRTPSAVPLCEEVSGSDGPERLICPPETRSSTRARLLAALVESNRVAHGTGRGRIDEAPPVGGWNSDRRFAVGSRLFARGLRFATRLARARRWRSLR